MQVTNIVDAGERAVFQGKAKQTIANELADFLVRHAEEQQGGEIVYEDLSVSEGHAQGDIKVQFLGEEFEERTRWLTKDASVQLGEQFCVHSQAGSDFESHLFDPIRDVEVYRTPNQSHPLVGLFCRVGDDGRFAVRHPEHRDAVFTQPGWYVIRFDRQGTTNVESLAAPVLRRVD